MTYYLKYLLVMDLRFDAILYSKSGNENSDAGHIKCSRGPQVPHFWFKELRVWVDVELHSFQIFTLHRSILKMMFDLVLAFCIVCS